MRRLVNDSSMGRLAASVVLGLMFMLGSTAVIASNMGFRYHKAIFPKSFPAPKGDNWVSFPYVNFYSTAEDLCNALNLTPSTGKIVQYDGQGGAPSHNCGDLGPFTLKTGIGVLVTNPTATSGILVGSHPSVPPAFPDGFKLYPLGAGTVGLNMFLLPYNSNAVNAQDLCVQFGLPVNQSTVQRRNALTGTTSSHTCGNLGPFNLVLGEAVVIRFQGGANIIVNPPHF